MLNEGVVGSEARAQIFTLSTPYIPELTEWYPLTHTFTLTSQIWKLRYFSRFALDYGPEMLT